MRWSVELSPAAEKQLAKLGPTAQRTVLRYLSSRLDGATDPRAFGKPLRGDLAGLWRYRVQDYRIIARHEHGRLIVLVVAVGHRRDVYE